MSEIVLDDQRFTEDAFAGLGEFSHVRGAVSLPQSRRRAPSLRDAGTRAEIRTGRGWRVPRESEEPSKAQIGATICRLVSVAGRTIRVQGLDALDGSPVLDIKPVFAEFVPDHASIRQPAWSHELMASILRTGCACRLSLMVTSEKSDVVQARPVSISWFPPFENCRCSAALRLRWKR